MARRICERAWRARRSQRARYLQTLRYLETGDYDLWQEELQRQSMAFMEALETLDTRAPQRRVQGGFQAVLPRCGRPRLAAPPGRDSQLAGVLAFEQMTGCVSSSASSWPAPSLGEGRRDSAP
eukprot:9033173-Pyramimonas_sp.AAC.1